MERTFFFTAFLMVMILMIGGSRRSSRCMNPKIYSI